MRQKKEFSWTQGFTFRFNDEGRDIEAWYSSISGQEKIFIDGALASRQRSFSTKSEQNFSIGDNHYSTQLKSTNLFKGPFVCTLRKNNQVYARKKLVFPPAPRGWSFIYSTLVPLALVTAIGAAQVYWQLPEPLAFIAIVAALILSNIQRRGQVRKTGEPAEPFIEDVPIADSDLSDKR